MSQTIAISDEAYQMLIMLARERGQSLEVFVESLIRQARADAIRDPYTNPRYQTFDEFFAELGMTPEEIRQAKEKAGDADL